MKKKIYIVVTDVPSLKGGAPVRNLSLIKQYIRHGYDVTVFALVEAGRQHELAQLKLIDKLKVHDVQLAQLTPVIMARAILLSRVLPYMQQYRLSLLADALKKACDTQMPDIIQFEEITAYDAVAPVLKSLKLRTTLVLDAHNVEQATLEHAFKYFGVVRKLAGRFVLPNIRKIENTAASSVDVVLACSEQDATFFQSLAKKVIVVANGADCAHFLNRANAQPETLLFMGGTQYPPNEQALRWYLSEIHPLVKLKKPNVRISILGGRPPGWLASMAMRDSSIILPGYVDDVRDYLDLAAICISPMVGGSGTSLKILEYMASSRAVVSTAVGARGIACTNGRDVLIADDATSFASGILLLMDNPDMRETLARNARKLMEDHYDWNVIGNVLVASLEPLVTKA